MSTVEDAPPDVVGGKLQQSTLTQVDTQDEQNLLKNMVRLRKDPFSWFKEIALFVNGTGWRAYDDVVGQPVFYSGYSDMIRKATVASSTLQKKLADLTERRLEVEEQELLLDKNSATYEGDKGRRRQEIIESLAQVVNKMIDNMICKMESKYFIRGAFYMVTQLLTRAYHQGIHVSKEEVTRLRAVASSAAEKKQSLIFLPCHKSHIDYVSLQLICYRLGITLPIVVAGDNLNFPIVGSFLQHAGAMWIRRSFAGDDLYLTLVQSYIDTLLQKGYNLECFIEGGRSRTGKLLSPKFGILSFMLDSVLSGRVQDAYIVPVSSQYDKVIEVDGYVKEMLGQQKKKENLQDFLNSSSVLSMKLGRIDVRFHEPFSLRQFIDEQRSRPSHSADPNAKQNVQLARDMRYRMLRKLGYRVLSDINDVSVAMPTALVGTVLLTLRGRGVGKSELARRTDWLSDRVRAKGGRVAHFHGAPTEYVVERAVEVLGPTLVGTHNGLAETTYHAVDRFQLSFYRNMTIHLFVPEALVAAALYTRVKQGGGAPVQDMPDDELTEQVTFLSQLFRGEFIFPAGEGLETNLEKAVIGLINDEVLESKQKDDRRYIGLTDLERKRGRENYDFYCFMIWPFVEVAWLGVVSCQSLVPPLDSTSDGWLDVKKVYDSAQLLGKTLYAQGDVSYYEAVNKEALKNVYARCEEEGIVVIARSKDAKSSPRIRVAPDWMPERNSHTGELIPSGRLWDFTERIAKCRREGKNRRDGATVSTRVVTHAARLGQALFEETDLIPSAEESSSLRSRKVRRRTKL